MKFIIVSWRAALIRRRGEMSLMVGGGIGAAIVYIASRWC